MIDSSMWAFVDFIFQLNIEYFTLCGRWESYLDPKQHIKVPLCQSKQFRPLWCTTMHVQITYTMVWLHSLNQELGIFGVCCIPPFQKRLVESFKWWNHLSTKIGHLVITWILESCHQQWPCIKKFSSSSPSSSSWGGGFIPPPLFNVLGLFGTHKVQFSLLQGIWWTIERGGSKKNPNKNLSYTRDLFLNFLSPLVQCPRFF